MRFISTKVHGILDYTVGIFLTGSPWILGFARGGAETWVPVVLGAGALVYSLCTAYELGAIKSLSVPAHLTLDIASGILLALSPWLLGFSEIVFLPHLIIGLAETGIAMVTEKAPREVIRKQP